MEDKPLDLEQHEEESLWDVWKRRLMFALLVALCITFAAPSFSSCSSALGTGGGDLRGRYTIGGETVNVSRAEVDATWQRLAFTSRLFSSPDRATQAMLQQLQMKYRLYDVREPQSKDDVWVHILLNAAAVREGVHVPQARIEEILASLPFFARNGAFDEGAYRDVLAQMSNKQFTHRAFAQTLTEIARIGAYRELYMSAFGLIPSRDVFERWRADNEKLSVSYVVQPFADLEAEVDAITPSDDDLAKFARLPSAAERLRVGARKIVEAAYFLVRDMTDVQVTELETLLRERGALSDDPNELDVRGLQEYFGAKDAIYTRENWLRDARAKYADAAEGYEQLVAAWEEQDEATRGPRPSEPPDPALDAVPEDFIARYRKFWRARIVREVLGREFLRLFAAQAERENRSFTDLAKDYETLGVRVVKNAEPLADDEFTEGFPEGLGKDSELPATVRTYLPGPAAGRTFVPEVHDEPVPTTRLGRTLDDRGYMVVRLDGFEPARTRDVAEAREEITEMWREHEIRTRAKARLEAIRDQVQSGEADLDAAAAAAGLTAHEVRRFNRSTEPRRVPSVAPGSDADAALRRARKESEYRNRVLSDYPILAGVEPGEFRASVLLDDRTEAAYLIRMDERHQPGPMEITPAELQAARFAFSRDVGAKVAALQNLEALSRRYSLELFEDTPPAESGGDADGADGGGDDAPEDDTGE